MFKKGSISGTILRGFLCISLGVGVISLVASEQSTAVATRTAMRQFAIGVGITGGSVEEVGPGLSQGWNAADGVKLPNAPANP